MKMNKNHSDCVCAGVIMAVLAAALGGASGASAASGVSVAPRTMPSIATVDERYQSYNVEMAEVIGGNFWRPYAASNASSPPAAPASAGAAPMVYGGANMYEAWPPADLTGARLRRLAAALGPAYMRVSGTWANSSYFYDADGPAPKTPPQGFQGVLTRAEWKGVVDFARAADAKLVTSFAISPGVRDAAGIWNPDQARKLLAYTKSIGGDIAAAEFFNEPTAAATGGAPHGYGATSFARDFADFLPFARATAPAMRIVGPGSVGEGGALAKPGMFPITTEGILTATPAPVFDIYSYHSYAAVSQRCAKMLPGAGTTADAALSDEWLTRPDPIYDFYAGLRDKYAPGKAMWITETAETACGGDPWAATFLDSFRYLDQLGRLARRGVKVVFHNTLASSDYGLLDRTTAAPRPNYWAALLWHRLMGTTVLDAGQARPGLHLYAQCLPDHRGGVTLLAINTSRTESRSLVLPAAAERYTLTASKLEDAEVQLNGQTLALGGDDALPAMRGSPVSAGPADLAPASITFLAFADAGNQNCQ
jgi:heparanase 1